MPNRSFKKWHLSGQHRSSFNQPAQASIIDELKLIDVHGHSVLQPAQQMRFQAMRARFDVRFQTFLEKQNKARAQRIETAKTDYRHRNKGLHPRGTYLSQRAEERQTARYAEQIVTDNEKREQLSLMTQHLKDCRCYLKTCKAHNDQPQPRQRTSIRDGFNAGKER